MFCPALTVNKPHYRFVCFGKSKEKANVSPTKKNRGEFAFVPNGGKGGIRTLGGVLAHTRFPVVRLRPAQPPFHNIYPYVCIQSVINAIAFIGVEVFV